MGNKPIHRKNFGGASLNWNEVKSAKVTKDKNGDKTYTVVFKTGVEASYPQQKNQDAALSSQQAALFDFGTDNVTTADNMDRLFIKGSPEDDRIIGTGITNSKIDVSGDNNDDHVIIQSKRQHEEWTNGEYNHVEEQKSENNTLILGENDSAEENTDFKRIRVKSNGEKSVREYNYSREIQGPGIDNTF